MMSSGSLVRFPPRTPDPELEWVGGRYTLPATVREGDSILQPEVVMWLELPSGILLTVTAIDPRKPLPFAETLIEAMARPPVGPPRRPSRIRVPDKTLADAVRKAVGNDMPVVVGRVPELDAVFAEFAETLPEEPEHSYLGAGDISPLAVGRLFSAAATFFRAAPWRHMTDQQIVGVDLPQLGIDGACLSVIGAAGESFGLLLFHSVESFANFASRPPAFTGDGEITESDPDSEIGLLSLSFDRKKDLPSSMLREIEQHRWPVAGAKAYPTVMALDAKRRLKPTTEREVRIMAACAAAFASFFARHPDLFGDDDVETVRETFQEDGLSVTLSAPISVPIPLDAEPFVLDSDETPGPAHSVGRNDPCPCGSGKKYKKCHLDADRAAPKLSSERTPVPQMGFELVRDICQFALERFGPRWLGRAGKDFTGDEVSLPLFLPWLAWTAVAGGKRIAESFLDENQHRLSPDEIEWFAAQRSSWLSVWEVTRVEPGVIDVCDLLTGERRTVREILASKTLVVRDAVLGRVVDCRDASLFDGMFARCLPPIEAAEVVRAVRTKVRKGKGPVAIDRLQEPLTGRFMIDLWQDAVDEYDERRLAPPRLQNTDGDPLLFVAETFKIDPSQRPKIEKGLKSIDVARDFLRNDNGDWEVTCLRADDTVTGRIIVGKDTLRIETNSERRADTLRDEVHRVCPGMLRSGQRTTEDVSAKLAAAMLGGAKPRAQVSRQEKVLIRDAKAAHYREWIDIPVPFLDGKTPRAATRSAKSREKLDLLLRDLENRESRLPEWERADIVWLRGELGLNRD